MSYDGYNVIKNNEIAFSVGNRIIVRLTREGMHYKGQFVEDAGEAREHFLEWMEMAKIEGQRRAKMNKGVREIAEAMPSIIEGTKHFAKLYKASYDMLVKEGFNPREALEIIKAKGPGLSS